MPGAGFSCKLCLLCAAVGTPAGDRGGPQGWASCYTPTRARCCGAGGLGYSGPGKSSARPAACALVRQVAGLVRKQFRPGRSKCSCRCCCRRAPRMSSLRSARRRSGRAARCPVDGVVAPAVGGAAVPAGQAKPRRRRGLKHTRRAISKRRKGTAQLLWQQPREERLATSARFLDRQSRLAGWQLKSRSSCLGSRSLVGKLMPVPALFDVLICSALEA